MDCAALEARLNVNHHVLHPQPINEVQHRFCTTQKRHYSHNSSSLQGASVDRLRPIIGGSASIQRLTVRLCCVDVLRAIGITYSPFPHLSNLRAPLGLSTRRSIEARASHSLNPDRSIQGCCGVLWPRYRPRRVCAARLRRQMRGWSP